MLFSYTCEPLLKLNGIATKMVSDRVARKHEVDKADMLDSFLAHGVAPREAIFELIITILGGSDTTSIGIRSTLLFIITNPRVYYKLQAEIDKFKDMNSNEIISNTAARSLPYLQAVIKEGLRILPPGTGQMPKVVPQEGENVHGIFIPGGTNIGINPWYILRDPVNFGADAEIFRPERWLEVEDQKRKGMEYAWELVWGYGKFKCLGHNIAMMEMGKVIFEVSNSWFVDLIEEYWLTDIDSL
jgi:cytochrome P450